MTYPVILRIEIAGKSAAPTLEENGPCKFASRT